MDRTLADFGAYSRDCGVGEAVGGIDEGERRDGGEETLIR